MALRDPGYLAMVRALPCYRCRRPGPSEAHHRTGAGMALKASDHETMPLCHECHMDLHGGKMERALRRVFQDQGIFDTQARLLDEETF